MEFNIVSLLTQMGIAFASAMVGTQTITAAIHGAFHITNKNVNHAISWIVATLVGLGFVFFNGLTFGLGGWDYLVGGIIGLAAGGCANGWYDWESIQKIFDAITNVFGHKDTVVKL